MPAADVAPTVDVEPAPVIEVDHVTVSELTVDLAARSIPPDSDLDDGLGSMRSIVFPVLGPVAYANGWGDPRSGGRLHEGTDIVGVRMQPILAAVDGVVSRYQPSTTGIRGVAISIADEDGWRYNYFHNNDDTPGTDDGAAADEFRLAPGLEIGDAVVAGQIIGYMGDSGNAEESVSHLHFELRDPTGAARPSYWSLRAAEARQACTIGIGPWSTPTVPDDVADESTDTAAPEASTVAGIGGAAIPPVPRESSTEATAVVEPDPIVEHTVVTPMFGEGQWVIDSEGRVTATGDAALIMPRRDLQCDIGPATPFGTDSAGWGERRTRRPRRHRSGRRGSRRHRARRRDPRAAARRGSSSPAADRRPRHPTRRHRAPLRSCRSTAPTSSSRRRDRRRSPTTRSAEPMVFTDPATGETIIVVFELPVPHSERLVLTGYR